MMKVAAMGFLQCVAFDYMYIVCLKDLIFSVSVFCKCDHPHLFCHTQVMGSLK